MFYSANNGAINEILNMCVKKFAMNCWHIKFTWNSNWLFYVNQRRGTTITRQQWLVPRLNSPATQQPLSFRSLDQTAWNWFSIKYIRSRLRMRWPFPICRMPHVVLSESTANVGLADVTASSRRPTDKPDVFSSSCMSQQYLVLTIGFPIIYNVYKTLPFVCAILKNM